MYNIVLNIVILYLNQGVVKVFLELSNKNCDHGSHIPEVQLGQPRRGIKAKVASLKPVQCAGAGGRRPASAGNHLQNWLDKKPAEFSSVLAR